MTLGQKLFEMRKKAALSQEQVAEVLGVTRQTVSKWETDQTTPDFDKIISISKLYNVSVNELFGEETKKEAKINESIDNQNSQTNDDNNNNMSEQEMFELNRKYKKRFAILLSVAICLYILSVIPFIVFESTTLMIVTFFIMIAAATAMIVFGAVSKPKFGKNKENDLPQNSLYKKICSIMSGIILVIYLLVSFLTGAWYITWILWIVYAIACEIVKLIFSLKGAEIDE